MLLALVMVFTLLPATVLADGETESVFAGWSLTLGENIGVNFYLAEEAASYTVSTTVAGNAANYTAATKDGYYVVTVNVAAAQMTDTIGLTVLNGETEVHSGSYTVRQYAEKILTGEYDDEVKAMVKEMLNYGAAAQTYFGYAGNGQANAGYELETAAMVPTEVPEIKVEDDLSGIGLYGLSLIFQSKTAVRFYFTVSGDISTYTFKVGETAYTPVLKDGKYYVEIGDINPQDLSKDITVSVNDGAMTVTYSPLNYIVRKYNNSESSDSLKALVQAMYGYHLEAIEYQKYLQIIQLGTLQQSNTTPWVANENETFIDFNTVAYTATTGEYTSLTADAIKLVRGGDATLKIEKTYLYYDGSAWVCSAEAPAQQTIVDVVDPASHINGWDFSRFYFTAAENNAPYDTGWSLRYKPVSADVVKVVKDGVTTNVGNIGGETVPSYASHPGVLGFLMYDEPSTQQFDELAALKAKFDAIDAFDGKLFYVNLLASCVADSSLFGDGYNKSQTDYDTYYVTEFLNKLDIQVLSWDNYSLISNADDTTDKGIRTDYFYNFEVMASKASDNLPLWYIMLSAGHTSGAEGTVYNTPTAEELRWQMAVALTYGVQNIDHYVYVSHADDYSSMVEYETWEPTALYYDIKDVNNEYLSWDNIFMAYDWVGVGKYSANSKDTMLDQLGNCLTLSNYGISSISASENTLVGVFEHNGQNAYMVTNAGSTSTGWFTGYVGDGREFSMADSTVTLTLDDADYKCVAVINNGEISYVAVNNNQVTLNVEAYEGVFVIPVLN